VFIFCSSGINLDAFALCDEFTERLGRNRGTQSDAIGDREIGRSRWPVPDLRDKVSRRSVDDNAWDEESDEVRCNRGASGRHRFPVPENAPRTRASPPESPYNIFLTDIICPCGWCILMTTI
jgi:hypothetical protein